MTQKKATAKFLYFDGESALARWPSVSLCMIVKNEEDNLADCIASVGDFASEIIIVDTGSTDRTVEIATELGAIVKHFDWIDDFAAARNESIKDATGDWIFWMDADDRLPVQALAQLKQAVVSGEADVYTCRIISKTQQVGDTWVNVDHYRLFRNKAGIKFEYALHETIFYIAVGLGLTIARTNIDIEHTGYVADQETLKAKARRNLTVVEKQLARNPDDLFWRYHRGTNMLMLENLEEAAREYEVAIANPPDDLSWDVYVYQAYTGLVTIYSRLEKVDKARDMLARAFELFPQRRHLKISAAMFHMNLEEIDEAHDYLRQTQKLSPESDSVGMAWPPGKLEGLLASVYLLKGELHRSRQATLAMFAEREITPQPVSSEILQQAQSLAEQQDYQSAVKLLHSVSETDPVALRLLADIFDQQQNWREAANRLAQAISQSGPQPGEWAKLAEFLTRTRQFKNATRICRLALAQNHEDVEALNLLGFIALHQGDGGQAMIHLVRAMNIAPNHKRVVENLTGLAEALNMSVPETVRQHGLRMLQQQQYRYAADAFTLLIAMQPANPDGYKSLALALKKLGRGQEAALAWQTAQEIIAAG